MEFRERRDRIFGKNLAEGARVKTSSSFSLRCRGKNMLDSRYDRFWAAAEKDTSATFELELPKDRLFSIVELKEYIPLGQRIRSFAVDVPGENGEWSTVAEGTTVGYRRLLRIPPVSGRRIRVRILSSKSSPILCGVGLYYEDR
jgi:alpha-L-fucosidase